MERSASGHSWRLVLGARGRQVLFFLLTWLGVASLVAFLLSEGHREAGRKAEAAAVHASVIVAERLSLQLQHLQADLGRLAASLPGEAFRQGAAHGEVVHGDMSRYLERHPEIRSLEVVDASGAAIVSTGGLSRSTGIFAQNPIKAEPSALAGRLILSEVQLDRKTGRSVLALGLLVRDRFGAAQGGLVAGLDLAYLAQTLDLGAAPSAGALGLYRADTGQLLAHRPSFGEADGPASGNGGQHRLFESGRGRGGFSAVSEGEGRIYGFQPVADYPLYVAASLSTEEALAEWRKTAVLVGISALLLFLSLSLLLIRLLQAGRQDELTANKLVESEARYRTLAENSHDVIWTIDIRSRTYTYVSPSVAAMSGFSPQELVGKPFDATLTPESARRMAGDIDLRLRRIAAGDQTANVFVSEVEQVCSDGSVIATESVSSYLLDGDGVARTILGITRNVSERKAAEVALRETNRQLHARIDEIGRLQAALQELAVRDGLTGLYNRRYLDETLEREVSRARREGNPLALVMIDIDYFKRVNDTYGHQVGDEALRMLASVLLANIRTEDVACRYGGEEFLMLLPNMPLEAALERAELWRSAVERLAITLGNLPITFTVSLGVAAYPEHGKTPDDLTRCADQALYRAKNEGRNQVSVYGACQPVDLMAKRGT
jgi:diguanylate cyclase (GGDEF)-like protein/PAS domain S-box-containing protein